MVLDRNCIVAMSLALSASSSVARDAASEDACFCLLNADLGAFLIQCDETTESIAFTPKARCVDPRDGKPVGDEITITESWTRVTAGKGQCAPCHYVPLGDDDLVIRSIFLGNEGEPPPRYSPEEWTEMLGAAEATLRESLCD